MGINLGTKTINNIYKSNTTIQAVYYQNKQIFYGIKTEPINLGRQYDVGKYIFNITGKTRDYTLELINESMVTTDAKILVGILSPTSKILVQDQFVFYGDGQQCFYDLPILQDSQVIIEIIVEEYYNGMMFSVY